MCRRSFETKPFHFNYLYPMKFYTSIADLYDEIFPYKPQQKKFIESFKLHGLESVLLDVGCGTGSLVLNLTELFSIVIGLEPDKEMLDKANFKALQFKFDKMDQIEDLGKWVFMQKGTNDIREEFVSESCNAVLCLGNTLVHLSGNDEVKVFLLDALELLKPGGKLMIQIINYDRIIDQKLKGLPTIENDNVKFERFYHYDENPKFVNFQTILTVKESGEKTENEIPLLAIRPAELKKLMTEAGYQDIEEFGNFKKEEFTAESQPYIVVGGK